jgi:hypothetical protein
MEDEIFILYQTGRVSRVAHADHPGTEEKCAWLAGLHPELIFFFAPAGSVESS